MSLVVGLFVLVAGGVVAATIAAVAVLAVTRNTGPSPSEAADAARRHAGAVTALAWVAAIVVALTAGPLLARAFDGPAEGIVVGLVPALAGLTHIGAHAIGEITWPRPTGSLRRAALTRRTARDVAPRIAGGAVLGWLALLTLIAVVGSLTGTADGRGFERVHVNGSGTSGPYPGWYYSVPILAGGLVVAGAALLVLRLIAARPAVVDTAPEWDLQMRRLSAHRVLRGTQLTLGLTAVGQLLLAAIALHSTADSGDSTIVAGSSTPYAVASATCLALALAGGLAAFVIAGLPGPLPHAPRPQHPPARSPHAVGPGAAPTTALDPRNTPATAPNPASEPPRKSP